MCVCHRIALQQPYTGNLVHSKGQLHIHTHINVQNAERIKVPMSGKRCKISYKSRPKTTPNVNKGICQYAVRCAYAPSAITNKNKQSDRVATALREQKGHYAVQIEKSEQREGRLAVRCVRNGSITQAEVIAAPMVVCK